MSGGLGTACAAEMVIVALLAIAVSCVPAPPLVYPANVPQRVLAQPDSVRADMVYKSFDWAVVNAPIGGQFAYVIEPVQLRSPALDRRLQHDLSLSPNSPGSWACPSNRRTLVPNPSCHNGLAGLFQFSMLVLDSTDANVARAFLNLQADQPPSESCTGVGEYGCMNFSLLCVKLVRRGGTWTVVSGEEYKFTSGSPPDTHARSRDPVCA